MVKYRIIKKINRGITMTNEDKAKEIAEKLGVDVLRNESGKTYYKEDVVQSALEAMEWKDEQHAQEKQQWIEKALKFLDDNFEYYSGLKIECLLEDFKKGLDYE